MKSCSLNDFMLEMNPWLDNNHIQKAFIDHNGHFVMMFRDGMKNVYDIDDCNDAQVHAILKDLEKKGVMIS